uniref:DAGKc domain-containing protein n=1 Tax=Syphacia muris TaxID=451379 RepID=A0A0N5AJB5_9BILA
MHIAAKFVVFGVTNVIFSSRSRWQQLQLTSLVLYFASLESFYDSEIMYVDIQIIAALNSQVRRILAYISMAADGADLVSLLPASNVVGTTRVRHPTIYVFTGGNEDAAFLSIFGFNLLLDGGDQKEIAYWNFIKNYDKINLVLSTRPSPNCLRGISTILARKAIEQCHPKIGAFIGNLPARSCCTGDSDSAKAILSVYEGLQAEGIKPYDAYTNSKMEPITLYEVIGEGSLKMFVLNPERGSKDLVGLANSIKSGDEGVEQHSVATSIAVVLIWQPFDHSKPTIRILYPGACPLEKLYASLERLKGEECLRHVEFVSADLEKYSSNLSLNARGTSRRTLSTAKTSPGLRASTKPSSSLSPRVPLPPKLCKLRL